MIYLGGAFTESAAYNFFKLPAHSRMEVLQAYFSDMGARFNLGRTIFDVMYHFTYLLHHTVYRPTPH